MENVDHIPEEFWLGVDQFNRREFYACHDTLEAVWMTAPASDKNFYQGILQIAVALYHLGNQNWRGAVILLGEGNNRLRGYLPDYNGIDLDHCLAQTLPLLKFLQEAGAEQVGAIAQALGLAVATAADAETSDLPDLALPVLQRIDLA